MLGAPSNTQLWSPSPSFMVNMIYCLLVIMIELRFVSIYKDWQYCETMKDSLTESSCASLNIEMCNFSYIEKLFNFDKI